MDFINSDRTLNIGDLVFSTYTKGDFVFKIVSIQRRFLTQYDLKYGVFSKGQVGDEYNPLMKIEAVADLSCASRVLNPNKKFRKNTFNIDAAYLKRAEPAHIQAHIKNLNSLLDKVWP